MKLLVILFYFALPLNSILSQTLSEDDLKLLVNNLNNNLEGTELNSDIRFIGCKSIGKKLILQYEVSESWSPDENLKENLIASLKNIGQSEFYFKNHIDVDFWYYKQNILKHSISIKSDEFSNLNFRLADYLSIAGHPKAKDVNLKLQPPINWKIEEGNRPNIVKKFVYKTNTYLVLIKDNKMFVSREEAKKILNSEGLINDIISESSINLRNPKLLFHSLCTIDTYPALVYTMKCEGERAGYAVTMYTKCWMILYEDKIVILQCSGSDENEFNALQSLYNSMTNSVIFPDQYD